MYSPSNDSEVSSFENRPYHYDRKKVSALVVSRDYTSKGPRICLLTEYGVTLWKDAIDEESFKTCHLYSMSVGGVVKRICGADTDDWSAKIENEFLFRDAKSTDKKGRTLRTTGELDAENPKTTRVKHWFWCIQAYRRNDEVVFLVQDQFGERIIEVLILTHQAACLIMNTLLRKDTSYIKPFRFFP